MFHNLGHRTTQPSISTWKTSNNSTPTWRSKCSLKLTLFHFLSLFLFVLYFTHRLLRHIHFFLFLSFSSFFLPIYVLIRAVVNVCPGFETLGNFYFFFWGGEGGSNTGKVFGQCNESFLTPPKCLECYI